MLHGKCIRLLSPDAWNHLPLMISSVTLFPLDLHFLLVDSSHLLSSLSLFTPELTSGVFFPLQIISSRLFQFLISFLQHYTGLPYFSTISLSYLLMF